MNARFWLAIAAAPLVLLAALLVRPAIDRSWENHPAHFWLVLGAALVATALGWGVTSAARRRRDARLLLISLAFIASACFLGLHALATPGVLLGPNAGFELATPVGLVLASVFAVGAALELGPERAAAVIRGAPLLLAGLAAVVVVWAVLSLAELPPLDNPLTAEQLDGWQLVLAAVGVALFGIAAVGFLRIHRRRQERFVLAFVLAFALLAEAMIAIAWAVNWQLSWWEWHVLMLGSFALIAVVARAEWHEERFSALYLDETLAGAKDVSILFADLAGFTSYSESREPPEVASMLNAYFGRLVPLLEGIGGEVHQITGDELMVVFEGRSGGAEHPAQAARAGLLLQRMADRIAHEHDDWPRFRVGVNSGEVHAGLVGGARGHRKHGFVGDVVNIAARLQAHAPVGGVLIGEETFSRLGSRALVDPLPPLQVKGKEEPVRAFVLQRLAEHEPAPSVDSEA
ncbi:MAG: adenylate/guanylate cyclase domain-containing protein [Gaiellaceae bacterium]